MADAEEANTYVVGENIVELQKLMNNSSLPPPKRVRRWQLEAEHIVAMAHFAKDKNDISELIRLDDEAAKLVAERNADAEKA